ncbi:hypothetical protein SNE25_00500 [Mucilaginibacter sabulilitoris]|uniref:DUF3108 domain-containing protein n=1 Tax=Mucilaginibacter sabulilitoris TaxID=1173583 RepID=A0ABZ0TLF5_9SPHI|nr:hypothetical protein [Mucilaginibacter sabulilitoris]WPU94004.1 hypothetical protein SNE25_00500 [Mucilaginibacter sabulilitoris]
MIKGWLTIFTSFVLSFNCYGQLNNNCTRTKVLLKAHVGKEYRFRNKDKTITYLTYLGKVETRKGGTYKVMTSIWIWGLSHRATSRVLIFNKYNHFVGEYYVGMTYDLPSKLKNNKLLFFNIDKEGSGCDPKLITYIDLSNGLPKEIFIKCKGNSGDIYTFSKEQ